MGQIYVIYMIHIQVWFLNHSRDSLERETRMQYDIRDALLNTEPITRFQ